MDANGLTQPPREWAPKFITISAPPKGYEQLGQDFVFWNGSRFGQGKTSFLQASNGANPATGMVFCVTGDLTAGGHIQSAVLVTDPTIHA